MSRYQAGSWESFTTADGLLGNSVDVMHESADGAIWVSVFGGVNRYWEGDWENFTEADGLVGGFIESILGSRDGAVWFGSIHDGLGRYDGSWQSFGLGFGTSADQTTLAQASDGVIWVGMSSSGVRAYRDGKWARFGADDNVEFVHALLAASDGAIWAGTETGISRYVDGNWQRIDALEGIQVKSLFESSDGVVWAGTDSRGVRRYLDGKWEEFAEVEALEGVDVNAMLEALDGELWFAITGGVASYRDSVWRTFTTEDGVAGPLVLSLSRTIDGSIWAGTSRGVSRYKGGIWQTFTTADGLGTNIVRILLVSPDGVLWAGAGEGGVSRYQDGIWQTFTTADGLAGNDVYSLLASSDGAIWAGTDEGVSRYQNSLWQTFTVADGLGDNQVRSLLESVDGTIWAATIGGASRFERPEVSLAQTEILRAPPEHYGSRQFFFEFRAFEIASQNQPAVSYALTSAELHDGDWSLFRAMTGFETFSLDNGRWTFYVRAVDRYGNIDPTPASTTFTVDLIAPTVVISNPKRGSGVSGVVLIEGSAFDRSVTPDMQQFELAYGSGEVVDAVDTWRSIGGAQSAPVEGDVLGRWDTEDLPDGNYVLRIQAIDRLGHRSVDAINVVVVSALEKIDEQDGGRVAAASGTVDLMIPPNALQGGGEVQIVFVPAGEQTAPPVDAVATGIAYDVRPNDLVLNKRATLTIGYNPEAVFGMNEASLAVFAYSGGTWTRLGGTVDEVADKISVGLEKAGTYALFEAPETGGSPGVSEMSCQPRIISPTGGLYPGVSDMSFKLGTAASVDVRIYGVSGNLVREIVLDRQMNSGLNMVQWDGLDRGGKVVRDGIYVVVVEADGKAANRTVGVLNR